MISSLEVNATSAVDPNEEKIAYINQLTYLTKILKETTIKLLESSDNLPIIIIQSDTGPDVSFTDTTNEVYYFPNEQYNLLYNDITPVNSFRIVFDSHFQTNYGIVEDKVFFSTYKKPYTLIEITDFSIEN